MRTRTLLGPILVLLQSAVFCGEEGGSLDARLSIPSALVESIAAVRISVLTDRLKTGGRAPISCGELSYLDPAFKPADSQWQMTGIPDRTKFNPGEPVYLYDLPAGRVAVIVQAMDGSEAIVAAGCGEAEVVAGRKVTVRIVLEEINKPPA